MNKVKVAGMVTALIVVALCVSATQAALTPGAIVDLDASNNPGAGLNRWTNLGTLGGDYGFFDTGNNTGTAPLLSTNAGVIHYSPGPGSATWGNDPVPGTAPAITGIENFTAEIWVRRTGDNPNAEVQLFGLRNADSSHRFGVFWAGPNGDDGDLDITFRAPAPGGAHLPDVVQVETGAWMQLAFTFDDATDDLRVYKNGSLVTSLTVGNDTDPGQVMSMLALFKTEHADPDPVVFLGDISRFRLYTTALTAAQVNDNFLFGNAIVIPEPATLLLLGMGAGTVCWARRVKKNHS